MILFTLFSIYVVFYDILTYYPDTSDGFSIKNFSSCANKTKTSVSSAIKYNRFEWKNRFSRVLHLTTNLLFYYIFI